AGWGDRRGWGWWGSAPPPPRHSDAQLHVGRLPQLVDVVPDRQLLAQLLAYPILHVLESDVALRAAIGHLEHDVLVAVAGPLDREHRHDRPRVRLGDGARVR